MEKNKSKLFIFALLFTVIILSAGFISAAPSAINLGTAGNFVILSNTGITNVPSSIITGNIGTSLDSANSDISFAGMTCAEVTGGIYSIKALTPMACEISDVTDGTTIVSTAVADMGAAYTAASDPATPAGVGATNLNVNGGTLSGNTFTPGVYTWNTPVTITDDITISGTATDIFVFQISGTLGIDANKKIILVGAIPQNIFWQVAGTTTLNAGSNFVGTILDQTLIEMKTGATLDGRALAQTAVTLDQNTISLSAPPVVDTIAPLGYTVSFDQMYINNANKTIISFTFAGAEVGTTYNYVISDSVNPDITGTGTILTLTDTIGPINLSSLSDGSLSLSVNLTDAAANIGLPATDTITKDIVAPTIDNVADIIKEATSGSGATVTITPPTSHDATDGNISSSCNYSTGTFSLGTTTVTCSKTDVAGNVATPEVFTVTIQDTTAPVVTIPSDMIIEATSSAGAVATFTSSATDLVDGSITSICSPLSGSTFTFGLIHVVTCTATDAATNTASKTFNVNVQDTTASVITLVGANPQNINKGIAYTELGSTVLDNYDVGMIATVDSSLVNTSKIGSYVVTYDVTDSNGNNAIQVTRTVNVIVPFVAQLTVDLGTASDYIILAKTAVSTTGTTSIIGNVGVSPVAATYLTGFGLIMDSTNVFSTSSLVTGKLYAADYAVPTPINMGTAISDMETAYTDAAGRTLPDATELGAGDISGLTITPGLYKWSTDVMMDSTGVTLSGDANAIWIFQISGNLNVANGAHVTLAGGAQAKNIFWQVGGVTGATLGTTSIVNGNILSAKQIILNTGAIIHGRALSQTQVTLDSNTVSLPVAPSGPAVETTITIVPVTANITIGSTLQINASILDQYDLPIVAIITYNSSNSLIATVNTTSGLVTAITSGNVIITASNGTVNRSVILMITPVAATVVTPRNSGGGGGYCSTKWTCTEWNTCSTSGTQMRICSIPPNFCTPGGLKPTEFQGCSVTPSNSVNNTQLQGNTVNLRSGGITGGVIGSPTGNFFSNLWEEIKGFFINIFK